MKIIMVELERLVPDKNNPRKTVEEITEIASSLKKNGQLKPIDVEEIGANFFITDGHRRYEGAKKAGLKELQCIVKKVLTPKERQIRQAQIDAQTKPFEGRDKFALWRKIWHDNKFKDKKAFADKLGVSVERVVDFFDYEGLSGEIKKLNINPGLIQETKTLKGATRDKVLKYAHKTGKGAMALRQDVRILKGAEDDLVDAFVSEDIDKDDVAKLKGLSKENQQNSILTMKHFKKQLKTIPDLVKKGDIKKVEISSDIMNAQQFVNKLQLEVSKTSVQISALEGTLNYILDEGLDKHFKPEMKVSLIEVLDELNEVITDSVEKINESLNAWRVKK